MRRATALRIRLAAIVVAAATLISSAPYVAAAPSLSRLRGIDEVKSWFNAMRGHPRLILLLSPT